jgi:flagellar motor component MotA
MDTKTVIILLLIAFLVLGVNGALFMMTRNAGKNIGRTWNLFGKAVTRARDPWKENRDKLDELSNLVDKIREEENEEPNN